MLIIITGLPGTGKTSLAHSLAKALDIKHLNSDIVRHSVGKRGHYDTNSKAAVYNEMLNRTENHLKKRSSVIVDATFYKNILRAPYLQLAKKYQVPLKWIELKANEEIIKERVGKKRKYSEADFEVYLQIKKRYEPLNFDHLILWSDKLNLEEMSEKAIEYLIFEETIISPING